MLMSMALIVNCTHSLPVSWVKILDRVNIVEGTVCLGKPGSDMAVTGKDAATGTVFTIYHLVVAGFVVVVLQLSKN